jgi:predicted negative regulator of RcsB-dependent stress response
MAPTATLTRTYDLTSGFVLARMALGHVALVQGRIEDAMQAMEPALETIEARGIPTWQPWAAALRGYALALAGRLDEGRALLELALESGTRCGRPRTVAPAARDGWRRDAHRPRR